MNKEVESKDNKIAICGRPPVILTTLKEYLEIQDTETLNLEELTSVYYNSKNMATKYNLFRKKFLQNFTKEKKKRDWQGK